MAPKKKPEQKPVRSLWDEAPRDPFVFSPEGGKGQAWNGKRFFGVLVAVAFLAAGAYYVFSFSSRPDVGLEFATPSQVLLGQPFTVGVSFSNHSDRILKNAKLSIFLPDGLSVVGQTGDQRVREQLLGDLGPGSVSEQSLNLIATEGSQTLKRLEAKLSYAASDDSRVQYESAANVDIPIGSPAIDLSFVTPQNVVSGEDFDIVVKYRNNMNEDFKNLGIRLDYAPIFQFKKSTIDPTTGNNYWDLGTLTKGSEGTFTVTGSVVGPEQSFFSLNGSVAASVLGQIYTITTQTASVGIARAPLSLTISLNGTDNFMAHVGDTVRYMLAYRNNADVPLGNVTIHAKLVGELFDFSNVSTAASFDQPSKTFTWSSSNTPGLQTVPPGGEGSVTLDIKLLDAFPIRRLSDKNYTLKIQGLVESPTVPPNSTIKRTLSVSNLETKVAGAVLVDAKGLFRDAASGILNAGSYPPRVGQATQFTVHWLIKNYGTDITNVKIAAPLGNGVRFTGATGGNIESRPVFDQATNRVRWDVSFIPAAKGVVGDPVEGVFQVEFVPGSDQVGSDAVLVGGTTLEAQDAFTGSALSSSDEPVTTAIPDDTTVSGDRHIGQ